MSDSASGDGGDGGGAKVVVPPNVWAVYDSPDHHGRDYYYNLATGETVWERPTEVDTVILKKEYRMPRTEAVLLPCEDPEAILYQGYLHKTSDKKKYSAWARRYCTLTPQRMEYFATYFEDVGPRDKHGEIDMADVVGIDDSQNRQAKEIDDQAFEIKTGDRSYVFAAESEAENYTWRRVFQSLLDGAPLQFHPPEVVIDNDSDSDLSSDAPPPYLHEGFVYKTSDKKAFKKWVKRYGTMNEEELVYWGIWFEEEGPSERHGVIKLSEITSLVSTTREELVLDYPGSFELKTSAGRHFILCGETLVDSHEWAHAIAARIPEGAEVSIRPMDQDANAVEVVREVLGEDASNDDGDGGAGVSPADDTDQDNPPRSPERSGSFSYSGDYYSSSVVPESISASDVELSDNSDTGKKKKKNKKKNKKRAKQAEVASGKKKKKKKRKEKDRAGSSDGGDSAADATPSNLLSLSELAGDLPPPTR